MKNLFLAAAAIAVLASPALAQSSNAPFADPSPSVAPGVVVVPGTRLVDPVETGTIVVAPVDPSVPGSVTGDPFSRTQGNNVGAGGDLVPSYQQGDNQQAGGPANELNSQTGAPLLR